MQSNIYPDNFALYWGKNIYLRKNDINNYAVYFRFETIFGDTLFTTHTTDSLTIVPFDQNSANEQAFHILSVFHRKGSKGIELHQGMVVKLLSVNTKIEALRALATTNASLQNLQLLADAYESEACYSNAYYIYWRMLSIDPIPAKENFNKFYQRNFKVLNPLYNFEK